MYRKQSQETRDVKLVFSRNRSSSRDNRLLTDHWN